MARLRRERSQARCQLAAMTERELQDCGITRAEIAYELKKAVGGNRESGSRASHAAICKSVRDARQNLAQLPTKSAGFVGVAAALREKLEGSINECPPLCRGAA
nr:DUF1127 domain-containing protein [Bradyrhizobium sp. 147]